MTDKGLLTIRNYDNPEKIIAQILVDIDRLYDVRTMISNIDMTFGDDENDYNEYTNALEKFYDRLNKAKINYERITSNVFYEY